MDDPDPKPPVLDYADRPADDPRRWTTVEIWELAVAFVLYFLIAGFFATIGLIFLR